MTDHFTRRDFLKTTAAGAAVVGLALSETAAAEKVPQRVLGKTGVRVPILGFGTAPTGTRRTRQEAIALYNEAIDLGVNYMDTAPEHMGYGKAQEQLGYVLRERRKEVFLVTKCFEPKADDALRLLEQNLKLLQTDYADLVFAHSIGSDKMDLDTVMGKGGVMEMLMKAKKEGLTKYIGVSGHDRPWKFLKILESFEIDVMMNAVNFVDKHTYDFENKVWPVAAKKNVGLVAMKVLGGAQYDSKALSNRKMPTAHIPVAIRYALGLPHVACAVIGMATREELRRNLALVKAFKPLTPQELAELDKIGARLAKKWKEHFGPVV
ncbi:MAG: aldo/keto reductase [Abditibacteriales bacterium]|nr:aldo/keto reductase [Abditibacteriales bacterium]MDW8365371.1 aldo/keto reductase [Abditibacteriales bacterium]